VQLSYQDPAKAMWIIRQHSNETFHKIEAGWCLDTNNKVMPSKPKGKSFITDLNLLKPA